MALLGADEGCTYNGMTTPEKPKVSYWAVFLGRSPPMPPVPAGGWTRETVNAAWRERIASHPEGAPLSHAALAELLRTRDTFGNWFIPRVIRTENEPPAPEASFFPRIILIPIITYYFVLIVAAFIFSFAPKTREIYPLVFLSEDTLCATGSSFDWRPSRCDAEVWATDLAFLLSLVTLAIVVFRFLVKGGMNALIYSQRTKKAVEFGGVGLLFFLAHVLLLLFWFDKYHVIDQNILLSGRATVFRGLIVSGLVLYVVAIMRSLRAAFVMVFFYITGRFPSWLSDLSS